VTPAAIAADVRKERVNLDEVEGEGVERHGRHAVLDLPAEAVRQPRVNSVFRLERRLAFRSEVQSVTFHVVPAGALFVTGLSVRK